jgi:hypothetical protein
MEAGSKNDLVKSWLYFFRQADERREGADRRDGSTSWDGIRNGSAYECGDSEAVSTRKLPQLEPGQPEMSRKPLQ